MKEFLKNIDKKIHLPFWLIGILVVAFILRIPSFFEPYWYGDEGIYLTLGEGVRQGFLLYRDLYDNKPPLLYLVATITGNVFWFRVILAFWMTATIYLFWHLGQLLFTKNERLIKYATIIFALLTTIPLIEGTIANAEVFMIGPIVAAFIILFRARLKPLHIFIAGTLVAAGVLFKVPAGFDSGAIILLWLAGVLIAKKKDWNAFLRTTGIFVAGIATPILITIVFFWLKGIGGQYVTAAFLQNIGYLSAWRGASGDLLSNNGPLFARAAITAFTTVTLLFLYVKRRVSRSFLFVGSWFALSLFAVTLSERPYPHYLIQIVPSFSFLAALAITVKTREQFLTYPLFALLGTALVIYKFYYLPVFPYYENFLAWTTGQRTTSAYFNNFDTRVNRNYEVGRFITGSAHAGDQIFVWGDDPEIYALTGILPPIRYVAAYHVSSLNAQEETIKVLRENPPRYIVTTTSVHSFPEFASFIVSEYLPVKQIENVTIWLLMNNTLKNSTLLPKTR